MGIRNTAKAIIIHNGKVLLNRCRDNNNGDYYSLPGGGQKQYETLFEAVTRECLEETGYTVMPVRLAALCEEICLDEAVRQNYSDYAHKMYHIFVCRLTDQEVKKPVEEDSFQIDSVWILISSLKNVCLLPKAIGDSMEQIISSEHPLFLGSVETEFAHG